MPTPELLLRSKTLQKLDMINERNRFLSINFLTILGSLVLLIFSVNSFIKGDYILGGTILFTAIAGLTNLVYFYYTRNFNFSATLLGSLTVFFCLYLVLSGGSNNTGPIWVYPLMAVAIFMNKVKQGVAFFVVFMGVCCFLIYQADGNTVHQIYTYDASIRFVISLSILSIFSIFIGYLQEKSQKNLNSLQLKLEETANIDSLTQLYNRHFIVENFLEDKNFNPVLCEGSSLVLIDIDNFKSINDNHGHQAGDYALKMVSETLKSGVRKGDIISRWGGEEFLIILANTPIEVAYQRAERFRRLIENQEFIYQQNSYDLTISLGVARITQTQPASHIFNDADAKLYKAKHSGKNKVC